MLTIREGTTADIELIREICFKVWLPTYIPIIGVEQVNYMLDLFYNPPVLEEQISVSKQKFLICHYNDTPVAFAAYSELIKGIYKLHKLYTLPQYQGKGAGKLMVDHIVNIIKPIGAVSLLLNVNRYNHPAIAFYKKYGFQQLSEEDIDIGNGYFMNDYVLGFNLVS